MRKVKKINGYLVVKFNDRERREWEQLGSYGVIDAELYTGVLAIDRGAMEYEDAETLEIAIEQARSLEAELDVKEPAATITIVTETDDATTEQGPINAQLMIAGWEETLSKQVADRCYPDVDARTATHELYGFKVALKMLGILPEGDCYVMPDVFEVQPDAGKGKEPPGTRTALRGKADFSGNDPCKPWNKAEDRIKYAGQISGAGRSAAQGIRQMEPPADQSFLCWKSQAQSQMQKAYIEKTTVQQAVEAVYKAVALNNEAGISAKRRLKLLESLNQQEEYLKDKVLKRAHFYAMEKVHDLSWFGLIK